MKIAIQQNTITATKTLNRKIYEQDNRNPKHCNDRNENKKKIKDKLTSCISDRF